MGKLRPQHRYVKIDGSSSTEPPRMPPEQQPSLTDKFASFASESYRKVTCQKLRQAFESLKTNDKIHNEQGAAHSVQLMLAFREVAAQVVKLTSVIEAGGIEGFKAARKAQVMVAEGLENLVFNRSEQSLNFV